MKDRITLQTGAQPTKEELMTANFIVSYDKKVTIRFLAASQTKGVRTPDIEINGMEWEIKCPRNNGKYTVLHMMQSASKQSSNIIVDLRQAKAPKRSLSLIKHESKLRNKLKNVIVITKDEKIIDIKGSLCYN